MALYLNDGWQPDVILLCCAEVTRQGRRSVAAVARGTGPVAGGWRGIRRGCGALPAQGQAAGGMVCRCGRAVRHRPHGTDPWETRRHCPLARGMGHRTRYDRRGAAPGRQQEHHTLRGRYPARLACPGHHTVAAARGQGQLSGSNILATEQPAAQQPAASAQKDLFNRDWTAMFDEEG